MSNEAFVKVNRVVRQIALQPERMLPLSRKALQLLREIPSNGRDALVVEGARNVRDSLRELYQTPAGMKAAQLAEEFNMLISLREPVFGSIH